MEDVFDYANNLHLPITRMFGFLFTSPWPTDSIPSMDTLLNTKPYIKSNGFAASVWLNVVTHVVTVSNPYWNMDAASQRDWLKTKKTLSLTPILGGSDQLGGYIMVQVPVGKEKRWVEDLKGSPLVSWTELNCYMQINGNP